MPGSYDDPVRLDPFRTIIEVGWPSGIEWILVERYIPWELNANDIENCDNGTHTPGDGGTHFPLDGQPQPAFAVTTHLPPASAGFLSDEPSDAVFYAFKADGTEVFLDTDPTATAVTGDMNTYTKGAVIDFQTPQVRVSGGATAEVPSFIQDWLTDEMVTYDGEPPDIREGTSITATRYLLPAIGGACWSGIFRPDGPGLAAAVIYWSAGRSGPSDSFVPLCTDETWTITLPEDELVVPATGSSPEMIFDPFGYTTEEYLSLNTDIDYPMLTASYWFRVFQIYRRRPTSSSAS